jgi:lysozyme
MSNPPQVGLNLIKVFEDCRLEAYQDQRGIWTIGYGHTHDVSQGMTCTAEQANAWLIEDSQSAWDAICEFVLVPLTETQGGALLSFVFNVGRHAFKESTLLIKLNGGHYDAVPSELAKWNKITVNGEKIFSNGLTNRRNTEAALWGAQEAA